MEKFNRFLVSCWLCTAFVSMITLGQVLNDEDGDTYSPSAQRALKEGRAPARLMSQFATIIECATGRSPILDYGNYGCFCGLGGKGVPLDATDECCRSHDQCYHQASAKGRCTSQLDVMTRLYSYRSDGCGTQNVTFTCKNPVDYGLFERLLSGLNPQCAHSVCECDRLSALCFKQAEFNPVYRMYNKEMLCGNTGYTAGGRREPLDPGTPRIQSIRPIRMMKDLSTQ